MTEQNFFMQYETELAEVYRQMGLGARLTITVAVSYAKNFVTLD